MPSLRFNPQLASLPVYVPGRPIDDVARELGLDPHSIIKLASNENPLGPSPHAIAAIQKTIASLHLYPDGSAFHLKRHLASSLRIEPRNLILGNGSNEVLELVGHAFLNPQTSVVVSQYCFAVYPIVTALFGARLVTVPARDHGHDLEAMLAAITADTRIVFVANPNNPTGTLAPPEMLTRFIQAVPSHVLVVLDEAYIEFLDQSVDTLESIRNGSRQNLLVCRTFSKIHGLAGLRVGYGIGSPEVVDALEKTREPFNLNSPAQAGALAALDDLEHVNRTRANNRAGLDTYHRAFQQHGLPFVPSHGNFVLVHVGDGVKVFGELQRRGIITRPMGGYQLPQWLRISIGTPAENERCLKALLDLCR